MVHMHINIHLEGPSDTQNQKSDTLSLLFKFLVGFLVNLICLIGSPVVQKDLVLPLGHVHPKK